MGADSSTIRTPLVIDGEDRYGEETLAVYDPAHPEQVVGLAAAASAAEATEAVAAAARAFPSWSATAPSERVKLTLAALSALEADEADRTELLVRENGKVRFEAGLDLQAFVGRFHQAAAFAPGLEQPERLAAPPFETTIEHLAMGVTTIIIPFNWPLAILAASLPYALMAGNTVVVKPPPTTPLSVVQTVRHVARGLPPGVLNVVTGRDAEIGAALVEDERVKKICFTGSVNGGRQIMTMATRNLANLTLELGGNDPGIVLEDAVLDEAAIGRLAMGAFLTTGQVCMAMKRLYVPRRRLEEVVEGLTSALSATRVGPGLEEGVTMGPLNSARQAAFVEELVAEAASHGAEVVETGEYAEGVSAGEGHYLLPRLVVGPRPGDRIVTEEQFGPALPILAYDDEEEAIAQANDTWSGLCSSVWSGDEEHGRSVAHRLRTGVTFFNNHNAPAVDERAPFGGFNQSGIGRELGEEGLLEFTETHVVSVPKG